MTTEIEKAIEDTILLANKIFFNLRNSFLENNVDPINQYEFLIGLYPEFSKDHPLILKKMVLNRSYNEKAFRLYLDSRYKINPPQDIKDFGDRQADYAKFLYIENCKANKVRWDLNTAKKIWEQEANNINKISKNLILEEKQARNEYEHEHKKNLEEKKIEFLEFIKNYDWEDDGLDISDLLQFDDEYGNHLLSINSNEDLVPEPVSIDSDEEPIIEKPVIKKKKNNNNNNNDNYNDWIDPTTRAFFKKKREKSLHRTML